MSEKKSRKALVTGADGFIGSHLTEMLLSRGWSVRALAQYNAFNTRGWLDQVGSRPGLEFQSGDIRDPFFCDSLCEGVDVVFHLAALIAIPYSYVAPQSYIETNVTGTLNVCMAAQRQKVRRVIHTSTSEVYGTARQVPISESHPLQPQSPYSASKMGADAIALSLFASHNLPLCIARPFNTFGPRQSARAIIPTVISQIASGNRQLKLGDITPTRDFNYVADTCAGFIALAEAENVEGEVFNFGSGTEVSIGDVVKKISFLMDRPVEIVTDSQRLRPEKSEVQRLVCDASKAKTRFGMSASHTLEQGLKKTIEWFTDKENLRHYKPNEYNV